MADVVRLEVDARAVATLGKRLDHIAEQIAARGDTAWAGYDEAVYLLREMQDEVDHDGGLRIVDTPGRDTVGRFELSPRLEALVDALDELLRDVA